MFSKINEFKNTVKTLKDLEGMLQNIDLSDPDNFINNINLDDIEQKFDDSFIEKLVLKYSVSEQIKEPEYAYNTDSGFDLRSTKDFEIPPFGRVLVPTGLRFDIPEKCELQVRPKSGLALKKGLSVLNTPGTVDNGYTGEVQVIVINLSNETQTIKRGDKIAQAVLCPVIIGGHIDLVKVDNIKEKDRNANGFGSTGN